MESAYGQHIILFPNDANVIVFHPNGDIIHRGGTVSNDQEIVLALQELHSLRVQNGSMISNRLCNKTEGRAEEAYLTRTALTFTALYVHAHSVGPGSLVL